MPKIVGYTKSESDNRADVLVENMASWGSQAYSSLFGPRGHSSFDHGSDRNDDGGDGDGGDGGGDDGHVFCTNTHTKPRPSVMDDFDEDHYNSNVNSDVSTGDSGVDDDGITNGPSTTRLHADPESIREIDTPAVAACSLILQLLHNIIVGDQCVVRSVPSRYKMQDAANDFCTRIGLRVTKSMSLKDMNQLLDGKGLGAALPLWVGLGMLSNGYDVRQMKMNESCPLFSSLSTELKAVARCQFNAQAKFGSDIKQLLIDMVATLKSIPSKGHDTVSVHPPVTRIVPTAPPLVDGSFRCEPRAAIFPNTRSVGHKISPYGQARKTNGGVVGARKRSSTSKTIKRTFNEIKHGYQQYVGSSHTFDDSDEAAAAAATAVGLAFRESLGSPTTQNHSGSSMTTNEMPRRVTRSQTAGAATSMSKTHNVTVMSKEPPSVTSDPKMSRNGLSQNAADAAAKRAALETQSLLLSKSHDKKNDTTTGTPPPSQVEPVTVSHGLASVSIGHQTCGDYGGLTQNQTPCKRAVKKGQGRCHYHMHQSDAQTSRATCSTTSDAHPTLSLLKQRTDAIAPNEPSKMCANISSGRVTRSQTRSANERVVPRLPSPTPSPVILAQQRIKQSNQSTRINQRIASMATGACVSTPLSTDVDFQSSHQCGGVTKSGMPCQKMVRGYQFCHLHR